MNKDRNRERNKKEDLSPSQRRRREKKKERLLRRILWAEFAAAIGLICFLIGRYTGIRSVMVEYAQSGSPSYAAGSEQEVDILADQPEEEKDSAETDDEKEENGLTEEEKALLILVNKDYALPEDYEVELKKLPGNKHQAAEAAYEPLMDMLAAGRKEGLSFEVCSSYRDVKRQEELFYEDVVAMMKRGYDYWEAYEEAAEDTMPPGHSEHSTGLAFDIVAKSYQLLNNTKQEKTPENKWLREHCAEYGFILRFPKGKEDVTKIVYESWHFRYVGVEAAEYIMENGITLEEYLDERGIIDLSASTAKAPDKDSSADSRKDTLPGTGTGQGQVPGVSDTDVSAPGADQSAGSQMPENNQSGGNSSAVENNQPSGGSAPENNQSGGSDPAPEDQPPSGGGSSPGGSGGSNGGSVSGSNAA